MNNTDLLRYALSESKKRFLEYRPHPKQKAFHDAGSKTIERMFLAGNRTGKTYCGIVETVMHLTGYYPDWWKGKRFTRPIKAWAASITTALTSEVLEEQYLNVIAKDLVLKIDQQQKHVYIMHRLGGTSQLTFKSYEQGRKKFQAAKLDLIHLDEEPPKDIYTESMMRLMAISTDKDNAGILLLTMTPLLGLSALVESFWSYMFKGKPKRLRHGIVQDRRFYIQAEWDDNPYLSAESKEDLEKTLSPHEREARIKGIPSIGSGLVYPVCVDGIKIAPFEIPKHWSKVYALDFGWTNPTAGLFAAVDRDNDAVYLTAEYYVSERTPQQHAHELIKMGASTIPGVYDPAGEQASQRDGGDLVSLYRASGLHNLTKADNSKELGVMQVLQAFQNGKLKIFSTLSHTLREIYQYSRDENGKIKKGNDHLMDCLRYLIMSGKVKASQEVEKYKIDKQYYESNSLSGSWMGW